MLSNNHRRCRLRCLNVTNLLVAVPGDKMLWVPVESDFIAVGLSHWLLLVRGRRMAKAQKILAVQWNLVHLHAKVLVAWRTYAHKLQASRLTAAIECAA